MLIILHEVSMNRVKQSPQTSKGMGHSGATGEDWCATQSKEASYQDAHVPVSRTCMSVALYGKRDFAVMMKDLGLPWWFS